MKNRKKTPQKLFSFLSWGGLWVAALLLAHINVARAEKIELNCQNLEKYIDTIFEHHIVYVTKKMSRADVLQRLPRAFSDRLKREGTYLTAEQEARIEELLKQLNLNISRNIVDCSPLEEVYQILAQSRKRSWELMKELSEEFVASETFLDFHNSASLEKVHLKNEEELRLLLKSQLHLKLALHERSTEKDKASVPSLLKSHVERYERSYREQKAYEDNVNKQLVYFLELMAEVHDPHSEYYTKTAWEDFSINMGGDLVGIGATLGLKGKNIEIRDLIEGGPSFEQAENADSPEDHLKAQDVIIAVDTHSTGAFVSTDWLTLTEVVSMVRGEAGKEVTLKILRETGGVFKELEISITREAIKHEAVFEEEVNTVNYEVLQWFDKKVAVVKIPSFYLDMQDGVPSVANDLKEVLIEISQQSIDAMMIDLRDNGGGVLGEVVKMLRYFIAGGSVVATLDSQRVFEALPAPDDHTVEEEVLYSGPLSVVVNERSASASEIFAGTLQDYGRALILGDSVSFGKGTVQGLINYLDYGYEGASKLTFAYFYLPSGRSVQFEGVTPDLLMPQVNSSLLWGQTSERSLPFSLNAPKVESFIEHQKAQGREGQEWSSLLDEGRVLRDKLRLQHELRIQKSGFFKSVEEQNEQLELLAKRKTIQAYLDYLDWFEAREEIAQDSEKASVDDAVVNEKVKKWHFPKEIEFNAELLNITADLSTFLKN